MLSAVLVQGLPPRHGNRYFPDVHRVILHLDMDAFYASVEQRDDPSLKGKPVIVGSPPDRRGVVCAASYEARKFGVRSAQPSITAGRLCPQGVFLRPRMDHYREESRQIMGLLRGYGIQIQQVSVDEAYLDCTALVAERGASPLPGGLLPDHPGDRALYRALPLAREFKTRIREERGLAASIGIAANKLLAKLASDYDKPDGVVLVPESDKVAFLRPLPVRAIHGVGPATEKILQDRGWSTVAHLQDAKGDLRAWLGSFGPELKRYALGEDARPLDLEDEVKSISSENTFERDTLDRDILRRCLWAQARELAEKLQRHGLMGRTLSVKVRYSDFTSLTRQVSLEDGLDDAGALYRIAAGLLARHQLVNRPLRLLGMGVSSLQPASVRQLPLPWLDEQQKAGSREGVSPKPA